MARTETLANLITMAKELSDMENSNFISDAEWYRAMNFWIARLHNLLLKADPTRFMREETLSSGTQDFTAPADYYGTVGIDYISNSVDGLYVPIPYLPGEEETRVLQTQSGPPVGYVYRYNNTTPSLPTIRIIPTPDKDCRHRYVIAPPKFATDGTDSAETVAGIAGFEDYIVIGMAIRAKIKEGSSVVQLREDQQQMKAELEEMAENRSIDSAGHVTYSNKLTHFDAASRRWGRHSW